MSGLSTTVNESVLAQYALLMAGCSHDLHVKYSMTVLTFTILSFIIASEWGKLKIDQITILDVWNTKKIMG